MDTLIKKIIEELRENVMADRGIKRIVYEDPIFVAKADTPCIIVYPLQTQPQTITNYGDIDNLTVEIGLVLDSRDYCGNTDCDPEDALNVDVAIKAIEIMEERDDDYTIRPNTIIGVIRKNLYYVSGLIVKNEIQGVTYQAIPEEEYPIYVATVRVSFMSDTYCRAEI